MQKQIQAAPTVVYPESDGKPMVETDRPSKTHHVFYFHARRPLQGCQRCVRLWR